MASHSHLLLLLTLAVRSFVAGQLGPAGQYAAPPPCGCSPAEPQPSDFLNMKQYAVYFVIQRFKSTITSDPLNVTATWVGYRPCDYTGFYCEAPPDSPATPTVASIDFNGFHLAAPTLAGFLDQFPDLALFHANSNAFAGTVPDLSGLRYFRELDLSNNLLSGPFPSTVLALAGLLFLDIRFNLFTGPVPPSAFSLGVEVLFINNNVFNGTVSDTFTTSRALYVALANNRFTGPLPRSCRSDVSELLFLNNQFSGCLPYDVGLLEGLTLYDAGGNLLTGPISPSFGCLTSIEELNLAQNFLYGHVPDALCLLGKTAKLANLSLSDNFFTSVGYSCLPLIKSGVLDVRRNCIPWLPWQRSPAECGWFLSRPKKCPFVPYVPCRSSGDGDVSGGSRRASKGTLAALAPLPGLSASAPQPEPSSSLP